MSDHITHVTDATFESEVHQSAVPVLVDFWAEWCGPCRMIAPILDDVAQEYAGRIKVAKVNVDDNQAAAARFGVRGIPTLLLFRGDELVGSKVGAVTKSVLTSFIDSHL